MTLAGPSIPALLGCIRTAVYYQQRLQHAGTVCRRTCPASYQNTAAAPPPLRSAVEQGARANENYGHALCLGAAVHLQGCCSSLLTSPSSAAAATALVFPAQCGGCYRPYRGASSHPSASPARRCQRNGGSLPFHLQPGWASKRCGQNQTRARFHGQVMDSHATARPKPTSAGGAKGALRIRKSTRFPRMGGAVGTRTPHIPPHTGRDRGRPVKSAVRPVANRNGSSTSEDRG